MVTPFPSMVRLLVIAIGEESTIAFPASESANMMMPALLTILNASRRVVSPSSAVVSSPVVFTKYPNTACTVLCSFMTTCSSVLPLAFTTVLFTVQ